MNARRSVWGAVCAVVLKDTKMIYLKEIWMDGHWASVESGTIV